MGSDVERKRDDEIADRVLDTVVEFVKGAGTVRSRTWVAGFIDKRRDRIKELSRV